MYRLPSRADSHRTGGAHHPLLAHTLRAGVWIYYSGAPCGERWNGCVPALPHPGDGPVAVFDHHGHGHRCRHRQFVRIHVTGALRLGRDVARTPVLRARPGGIEQPPSVTQGTRTSERITQVTYAVDRSPSCRRRFCTWQ